MDAAQQIRRVIDHTLGSGGICVFPAEVTVAFWRGDTVRRRAAANGSMQDAALPADRFISWDTFKETTTRSDATRRPVNRRVRTLFIHSCLDENRRDPWLKRLVPPEHAERSLRFAPVLRSGLPGLPGVRTAAGYRMLDGDLVSDLDALAGRYEQFLEQYDLFEPAWAAADTHTSGIRYTVFFPELLEDWPEFESAVRSSPDVTVYEQFPATIDPDAVTVAEYSDSLVELRSVLDRVEAVLETGVSVDSVMLTVADLASCRDELEREARRRGLPLGMRAGLTLAEHAAGGIFRAMQEVVSSRFSPDDCTRLFRSPAVPWFEPEAMNLLSRFGVEHGCLSTPRFDAWKAAFDAGGSRRFREAAEVAGWPVDELARQFVSLREAIESIVHASTFAEIRQNLYAHLIGSLVDPDGFAAEIEPVFQRCLIVLGEWIEAEVQTGMSVRNPFSVFLESLSEVVYVRPADRTGVPVYPYRVSAGVAPQHHFVVGLGRSAIEATRSPSPFLRIHERDLIDASEHDMTAAFLNAYACSGEKLSLSYSAQTFSGVCLAPPVSIIPASPGHDGLFNREVACWAGGTAAPPDGWYPPQVQGFLHRESRLLHGGPDYRQEPIEPASPAAAVLRSRLYGEDDHVRVSVGQVDALRAHPFGAMLQTYLGAEAAYSQMQGSDPMSIGSLEHDAIEWVHTQLRASGCSSLQAWREHVSQQDIEQHIRSYIRSRGLTHSPVPQAVLLLLVPKLLRAVIHALDTEARELPGAAPYESERSLSLRLPGNLELRGRIDAIHRYGPGGVALVDYKKSRVPAKQEIVRGERTQLSLYRLMLEASGQPVTAALYVSCENTREPQRRVFGDTKPAIEEADWPDYRIALEEALSTLAANVQALDFHCPGGERGCEHCPTREICRSRYAHRRYSTKDQS